MIEDSIFGVDSESLFENIMIESLTNYFGGEIIKNENSSKHVNYLWRLKDEDKIIELVVPQKVKKNNLLPNNYITWLGYNRSNGLNGYINGKSDAFIFITMDSFILCKTVDLMMLWKKKVSKTCNQVNDGTIYKPIYKKDEDAFYSMFKLDDIKSISVTIKPLEEFMCILIRRYFSRQVKGISLKNKENNLKNETRFQSNQW